MVVVGGGISGLASAYFFTQQQGSDKKILIIENHDDFGGHARRNEHVVDGKLILGEGGSESFEYPSGFSNVVLKSFWMSSVLTWKHSCLLMTEASSRNTD